MSKIPDKNQQKHFCPVCGNSLKKRDKISVDLEFNMAVIDGVAINFTPQQAVILHSLAARMPRVIEIWLLMDHVYGLEVDQPYAKIISVQVCKMRKKLAMTDFRIRTLWGKGFYLVRASSENKQIANHIEGKIK